MIEIDETWQPYVEKMREVEQAVKLTAYHTQETAKYANKASLNAYITAVCVKNYLNKCEVGE